MVQWPRVFRFFFFNFSYFSASQSFTQIHTIQQVFYLPKKGFHFSGEKHTTTCWNWVGILPLHHTKLNYLWLSQSPPGNEGKCQDQNLAGLAARASGLLREVFSKPRAARDKQPPSPRLAQHPHHGSAPSPTTALTSFWKVANIMWLSDAYGIKPKSQAGQTNPRGVSALPFTHENRGSVASEPTPPSTAPVHAPLKCTLHTNHSHRDSPMPGGK